MRILVVEDDKAVASLVKRGNELLPSTLVALTSYRA